jgi:glycosyltransferase involved in cell wall biosynthesis
MSNLPICLPKTVDGTPIDLPELTRNPLVSVVIPSFNQGQFIRATIDSILSQDYRPLQVIVVDGASRDDTVSILKSLCDRPELEWISESDSGVVEAVNKGFARARGDIIAIQSSDDCYLPGALKTVVQEFHSAQKPGLVYGDTVKIDAQGQELTRQVIGPYSLLNLLRIQTWIPQPSAFFRRELLDALGGWDDRIPFAPDTDLWLRMAFRTSVHKLDHFLSQRRIHDAQRDTQAARIARDYSRMIEQSTDVANASAEIRNAAHAGKHLMRVRYNSRSDWHAAWSLVKAGYCDRACLDVRGIATHLAWFPLRRRLSRLKRAMAPL